MAAFSSRNHGGFHLHSLLFAVCVLFIFLSLQGVDAVKAGGESTIQTCSNGDISINQKNTGLSTGIPVFNVEILNQCRSGCAISNIHVNCGNFASAIAVNPKLFRRLAIGDCLVNDGQKLAAGKIVSFGYANSFSYPLTVTSVTCAA